MSESSFQSADGSVGVIGGPHAVFTEIERKHKSAHANKAAYQSSNLIKIQTCFTNPVNQCRSVFNIGKDMPLLGEKHEWSSNHQSVCGAKQRRQVDSHVTKVLVTRKIPKCVKSFDEIESAGTEVTYRCVDCRNCQECKKSQRIDSISIQEEIEQYIINRCVKVNVDQGVTMAKLPFVTDPDKRLVPNEKMALRVYEGQVRKLDSMPQDKLAVIQSEAKLQDLGFVDFVDNLPQEDKELILNSRVKYFIPWRAVWNLKSLSTPCRLVLDASQCPRNGCSLNSLLAKGANNMNKLIEVFIRWTIHKYAFHCDIQKMYNAIRLDKAHWRYQMYLWENELKVGSRPFWKVIKTLIYGVRPSGNLAERGLRMTAELTQLMFPRAYEVIVNDIYVDDCMSGENSVNENLETTDQLTVALSKGGFTVKGFTLSKLDPPEHLSNDGKSVIVGGLQWYPKDDLISINIGELNFGKKNRGRKSESMRGIIPDKITRRDCAGKVAEIWDPLGRVAPLTSGFKMDLNELTMRKLDWDDQIPENLRQVWHSNFEMIQEIGKIKYNRAVVPEDAIDMNIETIDTADASQWLICIAIYARFRRKSGGWSCQLVFARSKVVPKDMTIPRAELMAADMNAKTGHVVKMAFGQYHSKCLKISDSQVALHWIAGTKSRLKMWVRNRVIEINRLVEVSNWRYIESENMIADIGTRKGITVADVGPDSAWINGMSWMRGEESDFPVKTVSELILCREGKNEANKETIIVDIIEQQQYNYSPFYMPGKVVPDEVASRYKYSLYVIDPNRYRFRKVVRILGLVFLFCNKLIARIRKNQVIDLQCGWVGKIPDILIYQWDKYLVTTGIRNSNSGECRGGLVVNLPEAMIKAALSYFFKKGSDEVKQFLPEFKYKNISKEVNGILYYLQGGYYQMRRNVVN